MTRAILTALLLLLLSPPALSRSFPAVEGPPFSQGPALVLRHPRLRWQTVALQATAYCTGNITATGTVPHHGTVAVYPPQIALGTTLYVPRYGWSRALDTGGLIGWGHVDLYLRSCKAATDWGRREIRVEVLR